MHDLQKLQKSFIQTPCSSSSINFHRRCCLMLNMAEQCSNDLGHVSKDTFLCLSYVLLYYVLFFGQS